MTRGAIAIRATESTKTGRATPSFGSKALLLDGSLACGGTPSSVTNGSTTCWSAACPIGPAASWLDGSSPSVMASTSLNLQLFVRKWSGLPPRLSVPSNWAGERGRAERSIGRRGGHDGGAGLVVVHAKAARSWAWQSTLESGGAHGCFGTEDITMTFGDGHGDHSLAPPKPPPRFDAAFGEWRMHVNFTTGKLVVSRANRPELAHLTVQWVTASGELDVHLKYAHEGGPAEGPPRYESIARIPLAALEPAGEAFGELMRRECLADMLAVYRKYRPGWLSHRGYIVLLMSEDDMRDWIGRIAPRTRGKYRVDPTTAFHPSNAPPSLQHEFYDARILWEHDLQESKLPVSLMRRRRLRSAVENSMLLSHTLGPDGTVAWWGTKNDDALRLGRRINAKLFDLAIPHVTAEHREKFELIVKGLGLDEGCDPHPFVFHTRQFFANPRNPIRQPYPKATRTRG